MLTITKNPPPVELSVLKQAQRRAGLTPRYHHLQGNDKIAVQKALLMEQGFLCAYCMKLIDLEVIRIEHWKEQSDNAEGYEHELDYNNLLGVCQGKIDFTPNTTHQDHLREHCERNRSERGGKLTIKPTDARLIAHVKFTENGVISSENSQLNTDLNDTLNLNIQTLKSNRANVWEGVIKGLDLLSRNNPDKKWSKAVVERQLTKFGEKRADENGNLKYQEFCGIVLHLLKKRLARI